ncbi:ester cyclase [Aequorivita soesokkakensis]|nr:ester cyclase [Aequorivita soesokkakensis]
MMKLKILLLLPFHFISILGVQAQNPDPHGSAESAITGIISSEINNDTMFDINAFAKDYAQAWCSQKPESVASFYAENGSLTINKGTPAVGRTAITQSAKAFMDAFPDDMIVAFDKLIKTKHGYEFHWTLTGTNTGPNGTGKKVNISGFELWQIDENGLIKESKGTFDAEEYSRQIKYGVND